MATFPSGHFDTYMNQITLSKVSDTEIQVVTFYKDRSKYVCSLYFFIAHLSRPDLAKKVYSTDPCD